MKQHFLPLVISLFVSTNSTLLNASDKTDAQKLDQALRQFAGNSAADAIAAMQEQGYSFKPYDKTVKLSPKAAKKALLKNGATKALDPADVD
ncbi:hypothetical protein JST99_01735 [Candidatus Dependentiae bacterium]|nr:hypothetical protein [Candidatus Dependentiae bacterium]MCC7414704.1 hypothetical protein [Campylobacterota bacterium]